MKKVFVVLFSLIFLLPSIYISADHGDSSYYNDEGSEVVSDGDALHYYDYSLAYYEYKDDYSQYKTVDDRDYLMGINSITITSADIVWHQATTKYTFDNGNTATYTPFSDPLHEDYISEQYDINYFGSNGDNQTIFPGYEMRFTFGFIVFDSYHGQDAAVVSDTYDF